MKALKIDENNCVFLAGASDIILGTFEGEYKYALYDGNGRLICYALPTGASVIEYDELPNDYADFKYLYVNGEFVLNPEWHEPEPPIEEKVYALQVEVEELKALVESQAQFIEAQSEMIDFIIMNNM